MHSPDDIRRRLSNLRMRLDQVNHAWTVSDHQSLLKFFVDIVPKIIDAEVCSIFIVEPGTDKIWSQCGTILREKELMVPKDGTIVGDAISSRNWVIAENLENSPYHKKLAADTNFITRNLICAPIRSLTKQGVSGAIEVLNKKGRKSFSREEGELLQEIANCLSMAIENIIINQEILQVSQYLNREIDRIWKNEVECIGESRVMKDIRNTVHVVSASPVNVLIHGESGTGKELIARMIHRASDRRDRPFVSVNCASIPENLMESEFFGYEKGAFTGAATSRKGRFEEADGGTLFLDEIRDMPMVIQPKFLRVIQEGEGYRLGSNKKLSYDLRIISATNRDLRKEVANGLFREDLFYRIFSVDIYIPPLRERREDIVPLAAFFLNKVSKRFRKTTAGFTPEVLQVFEEYHWPGNVRQLLHETERLVALTPEREHVSLIHCSQELQKFRQSYAITELRSNADLSLPQKVKGLEVNCIEDALRKTEGNKRQASKLLGITRQGLDKKMKRYDINSVSKKE